MRRGRDHADLFHLGEHWIVIWVIDPNELTASKRQVEKVTPTRQGIRVRGIEPGEWVATTAVHVLREGQKVRVPAMAQ